MTAGQGLDEPGIGATASGRQQRRLTTQYQPTDDRECCDSKENFRAAGAADRAHGCQERPFRDPEDAVTLRKLPTTAPKSRAMARSSGEVSQAKSFSQK